MARYRAEDGSERMTAFFGFQCTPAQKSEIVRRAEKTGRFPADFARIVLLSDLKTPAPSARDPQAIRELAVEISRVGNNLNQLAFIANRDRATPQLEALKPVLNQIVEALEKVITL